MLLKAAVPAALSVITVLGMAGLIGLLTGLITVRPRIPSVSPTLGTLFFWTGMALGVSGGWPISFIAPLPVLNVLGNSTPSPAISLHVSAAWWAVAAVIFWIMLEKTRYGNWVYGTGGKTEAARAIGAPVDRVKLINFTICGLLAGRAGRPPPGRLMALPPVRSRLER